MADYVLRKGKKVTIVDTHASVADGPSPMYLRTQHLLRELTGREVGMLCGVKYEEITDKGLVITDNEGKHRIIKADTIVLALGSKEDMELADSLKARVSEVYLTGDCVEPYGILEAIASGSRVARMV